MDASMKFMNNQYEDLLKEHATSMEAVRELQKENFMIKSTMSSLKIRLEQLEQQTRSNNVEIQCLPEKKQENLFNIVSDLSKTVGCSLENRDILHCTRIAKLNPEKNRPRSIIVQLASPRIRDQFLASVINFNKANRENKLNTTHLGFTGPKTAIYVMEHLSPTYKSLHAAARLKAKELGYKFVWVRGGKIFLRKAEETEHIMVKNMDILNKLS
uniref:FP protein C-terminal domain-containing protein n=1 Tax=Heliothis virescens TaxID=7102 RepID=A0A2A4J8C8_HELVI